MCFLGVMRFSAFLILPVILSACIAVPAGRTPGPLPPATRPILPGLGLPLLFEENRGQADPHARFVVRSPAHIVFLGQREITMVVAPAPREAGVVGLFVSAAAASQEAGANRKATAIRMRLVGASASEPRGEKRYRAVVRHMRGNGKQPPREIASPAYRAVRYPQVYPGIDLVFHGRRAKLSYDFEVAPGADPGRIRLRFAGAEPRLDSNGNLVLETRTGRVIHAAPAAYQLVDGRRARVRARFVLAKGGVGVDVAGRDPARRLVIDPVIAFATYLGGAGSEFVCCAGRSSFGVAADGAGHVYVVGTTRSDPFPETTGALQGFTAAFVARFNLTNPQSPQLDWVTLLDGEGSDHATGVAVAGSDVYVSGWTNSNDFPTTLGTYRPDAGNGNTDRGYVARLDATGAITRATYLGMSTGPALYLEDVAVDPASGTGYPAGVYVTGAAYGDGLGTLGAFQQTHSGVYDAVVARLSLNLANLDYLTYLGGLSWDWGVSIAVQHGIAYVAGQTTSVDFPVSPGAAQTEPGIGAANVSACPPGGTSPEICYDGFAAAIGPTGGTRVYATFLGGPAQDGSHGVAVDPTGRATVVGWRGGPGAGELARVDRLEPNGQAVPGFGVNLGGGSAHGVALDAAGGAQVTGSTSTPGLATPGAVQTVYGSGSDAFLATVDAAGSLSYFTYLGGNGPDYGGDVAVDGNGTYIVGATWSDDFLSELATQPTPGGEYDAFLVWLAEPVQIQLDKSDSPDPATVGQPFTYYVTVTNAGPVSGLNLTDAVPSSLQIQSVFPPSCNVDPVLNAVNCSDLALADGQGFFAAITVMPSAAGQFCNIAQLQVPGLAAPLEATECTTTLPAGGTPQASLAVTKSGPTVVGLNQSLSYVVTVTNTGTAQASAVQFVDEVIPSKRILFESLTSSIGTCSIPTDFRAECSLGALAAGDVATLTIHGRSDVHPGLVENRAQATFGMPASGAA
ncbi:MAG: hypothetical protein ACTS8S_08070, partial [Giesbergeria sp.]